MTKGRSHQGRAIPSDFDRQCRLAGENVRTVLAAAGMTVRNLAKVTVYLSDRRHREASSRIRHEVLGDHRPAVTITPPWELVPPR